MVLDDKMEQLDAFLNRTAYVLNRRKKSPGYPSKISENTKDLTNLLLMTNPSQEKIDAFLAYVPGEWMLQGPVDERHLNVGIETLPEEVNQMIATYKMGAKTETGPNLHLS